MIRSKLGLAASIITTAVLLLYVYLSLDPPPGGAVARNVSLILLALAATAAAGSFARKIQTRRIFLSIAAFGLFVIGFLGIFSIGFPLVIASILALIGAIITKDPEAIEAGPPRLEGP